MGSREKPQLPAGYKSGKLRTFVSTRLLPAIVGQTKLTRLDHLCLFAATATAFLTRFYKLPEPPKVVFDETHFGGFAREYYDGEFFVDVHPPLVKLIFYWIALLFHWDGQFEFESIGDTYDGNVPYIAMKSFSAACGAATVALVFLTLRASGCRSQVALFGSSLALFETSLATQSRLIMLDSGLVCFTALTVFAFTKFKVTQPFSKSWFKYLLLTGIGLGLTVSTKLTGLFTFAWIGLWTVWQLWNYVGDLEVPLKTVGFHILARLVSFIFVPLTIYCGLFSIHFMLLPNNGSGSGAVSPSFKAEFEDSGKLRNTAVDVSYGSTVTIKHHRLDMYLHSHPFEYKSGTGQQQVTMYGYEGDGYNDWVLEMAGESTPGKFDTKFRPIKDGDTVKLLHKMTGKYLRASDVRPPNSEHDYSNEVSCHGNRTDTAEINYEWRVKIFGKKPHSKNELPLRKVRATESVFQLVHRGTHCTLLGHDTKLPDWAFHQNQVFCMNEPNAPNTLWYIENNNHPVIDKDVENYPRVDLPRLLLFQKLVEYHHSMWRINLGFTKPHDYASLPMSWPFVSRGINYFSNSPGSEKLTDEPGSHIYLLGNPFVYYAGLFVIVIFVLKIGLYVLRYLNPFRLPSEQTYVTTYYMATMEYASGWALHFFPYVLMLRQLFAHHYLTSVYFLVLLIGQYLEYQTRKSPLVGAVFIGATGVLSAFFFVKFAPLVYGLGWTVEQCQAAKWMLSWDFDCTAYSQ